MKKNFKPLILLVFIALLWFPKAVNAQTQNCLAKFNPIATKIKITPNTDSVTFSNIDQAFVNQSDLLVADITIVKRNGELIKENKIPVNQTSFTVDLAGKYVKGQDGIIVVVRFNYVGDNFNEIMGEVPNYILAEGLGGQCNYDELWNGINENGNKIVFMDNGGDSSSHAANVTGVLSIAQLQQQLPQYDGNFAIIASKISRNFFGTLDSFDGVTPGKNQTVSELSLKCDANQDDTSSKSYVQQKTVTSYSYSDEYSGKEGGGQVGKASVYCMEVIEVSYDKPIALTAGMGFGYDIKVETKAECEVAVTQVPTAPDVCVPRLSCDGAYGTTATAGPNDEFDACIMNCDGGKYTQSCINKCYDSVYNKAILTYENRFDVTDIVATPIYATSGNGWTLNTSGCDSRALTALTYDWSYYQSKFDSTPGDYICMTNDNSNGTIIGTAGCQYSCGWSSCGAGTVLTDDEAQEILDARNANFINWLNSQTDAVKTYYNAKEDSADTYSYYEATIENGTTDNKNKTTTLKTQAKYSDNVGYTARGNNIFARSTITYRFPQSYREALTGAVVYGDISSNKIPTFDTITSKGTSTTNATLRSGYKFYTALRSLSTNTDWWAWRTNYDNQVKGYDLTNAPTDNTYNIQTKLTNLGFLGWDFDVDCFYALPADDLGLGLNFVFRPIDLSNVQNMQEKGGIRENPRWNWSASATTLAGTSNEAENTQAKDRAYIINPPALIDDIEAKQNTIYDTNSHVSTELDYEIKLSRETMTAIRSYNTNDKDSDYLEKDMYCYKTASNRIVCKSLYLDSLGTNVMLTRDTNQIGCNNYDPGSKTCDLIGSGN